MESTLVVSMGIIVGFAKENDLRAENGEVATTILEFLLVGIEAGEVELTEPVVRTVLGSFWRKEDVDEAVAIWKEEGRI